jgi:transposase-like protein
MTEIKNREVCDILIAVVDGLKGLPEAITAVFPLTAHPESDLHRSSDPQFSGIRQLEEP